MSNVVIALLLGIGVAGWVFNKIGIKTGGSTSRAAATAVVAGILAFLIMITALSFLPD